MKIDFIFKLDNPSSQKHVTVKLIPKDVEKETIRLSLKECLLALGDYIDQNEFKEEYTKFEVEIYSERSFMAFRKKRIDIKFQFDKDGKIS